KMQAAMGSVKSAAAMAHAALLTRGFDANYTGTPTPNIVMEGTVVTYVNGYPDTASIIPLSGLAGDYVVTGLTAPRIAAPGAIHDEATPETCYTIAKTPPAAANTQPTYALNATVANCS